MKEEIEEIIPLIKSGNISDEDIENLVNKIRTSIKNDPQKGKELGIYFSIISKAQKINNIQTDVNWTPVLNGEIAIGHKPGGKISFEGLKNEGATTILTLLHENEGAVQIRKEVEKAGIKSIWFPFSASKPHTGESIQYVIDLFENLSLLIQNGDKIYIHCSAGIHRTGMITYGFFRYLGYDKNKAYILLKNIRAVTAEQVGEERLQWADQFGKSDNE